MAKGAKMNMAAGFGAKGGPVFSGKKAPSMPANNMGGGKPFGGKAGKVKAAGKSKDKC